MPSSKNHYWVVVPPSQNSQIWKRAIIDQCLKQNIDAIDIDATSAQLPSNDAVILTSDVEIALNNQVKKEYIIIIISDSGLLPIEIDTTELATVRHAAVKNGSELHLKATKAVGVRKFFPREGDEDHIEITPNLFVPAPKSEQLSSKRNRTLHSAMKLYAEEKAHWGGEIFDYIGEGVKHRTDNTSIDVTGRPRFLIFGPYITMPPGLWKVVARFTFSHSAAQFLYRADWGQQQVYESYNFRPGREGSYELEMTYEWPEVSSCEFRLLLCEGAFQGEIVFLGLDINRAP